LQFLDRQGVLQLSSEFSEKVQLQFTIPSKEVLRYCSLHPKDEAIVSTLMRLYPGIYDMLVPLNIPLIAQKSATNEEAVVKVLEKLQQKEMVVYQAHKNDTAILFMEIRDDDYTINRIAKYLISQNELKTQQLQAVLKYSKQTNRCCSQFLAAYFGDSQTVACGHCSVCSASSSKATNPKEVLEIILAELQAGPFSSRELEAKLAIDESSLIFALQSLLENKQIKLEATNRYTLY
jgi:ATP-dependent DNA helicase RecQ